MKEKELITGNKLLKLGFSKRSYADSSDEYNLQKNEFEMSWDAIYGLTLFSLGGLESFNITHAIHIYDVQYLYLGLTGEELTEVNQ